MALSSVPLVATSLGSKASAPDGAIPIAAYGFDAAADPIVAALIAAGFGTAGQVLTTNATEDGFTWTTPA